MESLNQSAHGSAKSIGNPLRIGYTAEAIAVATFSRFTREFCCVGVSNAAKFLHFVSKFLDPRAIVFVIFSTL